MVLSFLFKRPFNICFSVIFAWNISLLDTLFDTLHIKHTTPYGTSATSFTHKASTTTWCLLLLGLVLTARWQLIADPIKRATSVGYSITTRFLLKTHGWSSEAILAHTTARLRCLYNRDLLISFSIWVIIAILYVNSPLSSVLAHTTRARLVIKDSWCVGGPWWHLNFWQYFGDALELGRIRTSSSISSCVTLAFEVIGSGCS